MDASIDDQLYFLNHNQPYNALFDADPQHQSLDDEPLYVNAKQYFRILKRRVARSRLDEVHRLSRQRKPYLHESRHKHAMRRPRGPGGRFLTAEEIAAQKRAETANGAPENDKDDADDDDSPTPDAGPSTQHDVPIIEQHHDSFFQPDLNPPPAFRPPSMPVQQPIPHISSHSHSHSHSHQHSHVHQHQNHQSHHARAHMRHSPPRHSHSGPYPFQAPISSQYTPPPQMHHVPHPHAHARHHHSNPMYWPDPMTPDMSRRSDDSMMQFGAQGPN